MPDRLSSLSDTHQSSATSAWNSVWLRIGASRVFIGRSQRGREGGGGLQASYRSLHPSSLLPSTLPAAFPIVNLSDMSKIRDLS